MAVDGIKYTKILKDEDWLPKKLESFYISLINDPIVGRKPIITETSFNLMPSKEAAGIIAKKQQVVENPNEPVENYNEENIEEPVENYDEENYDEENIEENENVAQNNTTSLQITNMPITIDNSSEKTTFTGQGDFVQKMTRAYRAALQQRGLNPEFASYLVAQDALESGWGAHQAGKNNFGGIKETRQGKGVAKETKEWNGSKMITIRAPFRDFDSLEDYVNYKLNLVGNNKYNVFAYKPTEYFNRMRIGGYATDPNYINKMNGVLSSVLKYA